MNMMSLPVVTPVYYDNLVIGVGNKVARGTGTTADVKFYVAQMPVGTVNVRAYVADDHGTPLDLTVLNDETYSVTFTLPAGTHKAEFIASSQDDEEKLGSCAIEVIA